MGWDDLLVAAIEGSSARTRAEQWDLIEPIMREAEALPQQASTHANSPRRIIRRILA